MASRAFWRERDQLSFLTTAEKRTLAGIEELFSSPPPSDPASPAAKGLLLREPTREERNRVCDRLSAELYALNKNADDIIETILRLSDQLERETADADSEVQSTLLEFVKDIVDGALTIRELLQNPASIARLGAFAAGSIFSLVSLIGANKAILQYIQRNKRIEALVNDIDYHLGKLREMRDLALQKLKEMQSMGCPFTF